MKHKNNLRKKETMKTNGAKLNLYTLLIAKGMLLITKILAAAKIMPTGLDEAEVGIGSFVWFFVIGRHRIEVELNYASERLITVIVCFDYRRSDGGAVVVKSPRRNNGGLWEVSCSHVLARDPEKDDAAAIANFFGLHPNNGLEGHGNDERFITQAQMLAMTKTAANYLRKAAKRYWREMHSQKE
jgi:hypothetical protein